MLAPLVTETADAGTTGKPATDVYASDYPRDTYPAPVTPATTQPPTSATIAPEGAGYTTGVAGTGGLAGTTLPSTATGGHLHAGTEYTSNGTGTPTVVDEGQERRP